MIKDKTGRVLAIDYGTVRIGIAISDPLRLFPSKTFTLINDKNIIENLSELISENDIEIIILGFPESKNNKLSQVETEIIEFKKKLERKVNLTILLWDEHHTSRMAADRIIESVKKKSKRKDKSLIDAQSAAIILEEYLKSLTGNSNG